VGKVLGVAAALAVTVACGSNGGSPTTPSAATPAPATPAVPTRIITLTGDLGFSPDVQIGQSATRQFSIKNTGNATMTVTGMTGTGGITAVTGVDWTQGAIAPGATQVATLRFTPTAARLYVGDIGVTCDATTGINTIRFTGSGTLNGIPVYSKSGHGDTFFTLPAYVTKIHIHGHFVDNGGLNNSNFIVSANGSNFINEILRINDYDADRIVPAGATLAITNSSYIDWSFTEMR
jgi:hypothetical protein